MNDRNIHITRMSCRFHLQADFWRDAMEHGVVLRRKINLGNPVVKRDQTESIVGNMEKAKKKKRNPLAFFHVRHFVL